MEIDKMNKKELRQKYNEEVEKYNKANDSFNIQLGKLVMLDKLKKEFKEPSEELKNFISQETKETRKTQKQALTYIKKHVRIILELDEQLFHTVANIRANRQK